MSFRLCGRTSIAAAVTLAVTAGLSACSGGSPGGGGTGGGTPVTGGTLKIVGSGDIDHLDTASAYYPPTYTLGRAFTRQLFTYPASADSAADVTPVADLATTVPNRANGGISADGLTYTIRLRTDAKWNTTPARPITAQDEVLGLKRLCNPVAPVGAPGYYEKTILGMQAYCDGFAEVAGTVDAIKAYIDDHDISGVTAADPSTVVIKLTQPASDFVNIMAMPFASPTPVEYLKFLPDSAPFRSHTISDGPYTITSYTANQSIKLARNPAWSQASDPVRHQYVNEIAVTEGQDTGPVQQQIQAGTADMEWDTTVPTPNIPALEAAKDPNLIIAGGSGSSPYIVFNLQDPNSHKALQNVKVRQAIEYAIDKVAIGQVYGGPALNTPLNQALSPDSAGYVPFDPYPTAGSKGDAAKCRSMLAAAGYAVGSIKLTDIFRNAGNHPAVAQVVQADLKACGIEDKLVPVSETDFFSKYIENPDATKRGVWSIAEPAWSPDWLGNNARSIISPLFDGRGYGPNSVDYGDYNSPAVSALIDKALSASTEDEAATYWHQADVAIMADAPIVPVQFQKTPLYHSSRVKNAVFLPFSQAFDVTNLWLSPTS